MVAGLAGWRKIELGLVPFGAAGVAVSLLFAATRTAAPAEVHLMIPY